MDLLIVIALPLLILVDATYSFRIGAFNIQIFGKTKAKNVEVMDNIVKILQRYDIVLIEEIRDGSGSAIDLLHQELNKASNYEYKYIVSERLGKSASKEQYAYIYRPGSVSVISEHVYDDTKAIFQRPPYIAKFQAKNTVTSEFVLAGIHTQPTRAIEEISELENVANDIISEMKTQNILILGDMNADCHYAPKSKLDETHIKSSGQFHWLLSSNKHSAVSTDCTYDRIILHGEKFLPTIVKGSSGVFYYDKEYDLSKEQTKAISDHYPVELQLQTIEKEPLKSEL